MTHTTGTFTVTEFIPQDFTPKIETGLPTGYALMRKEFSGAIRGTAQTQFVFAYDEERGGTYVALESFTGAIDGHEGTCNLAHSATTIDGSERSAEFLVIVPGSGTDALAGISGTGTIAIDSDGTHHLNLSFELPGTR